VDRFDSILTFYCEGSVLISVSQPNSPKWASTALSRLHNHTQ